MTADEAQRTTLEKVRVLQRKLYRAAKAQPQRTFGVLFDKVCRLDVLWFAWEQVRRNRGAAGVDGETIESIEAKGALWFLLELREELIQQRYRPQPVRRVFIPKPDGRQRPLGIPGVKDRVAQAAVKIVIEPLFEASFRPGSYGFRPKRSAKQAIYDIRKWVTYGYDKVIDLDLKELLRHDRPRNPDHAGATAGPRPTRAAADSVVVESRSDARRHSGRDGSRLPARGSDLAVVVQHLLAPARSVLGAGGEGDEDGPLCG